MFVPRLCARLFAALVVLSLLPAITPGGLLAQESPLSLSAPPAPVRPPDEPAAEAAAEPAAEAAAGVAAPAAAQEIRVFLPTISGRATAPAQTGPVQGVQFEEAVNLYRTHYLAYRSTPDGWTGSVASCQAGAIGARYSDALALLVNYYRKMAGVQPVTFDAGLNAKSQAAALMMSANKALSHSPPSSWRCFSKDGATAAGNANLALYGGYGPDYHGINLQMEDPGDGNWFVGHRRWILYPQTQMMGIGQVPPGQDQMAATVLWVFDPKHLWDARPPVRDGYVAWPAPGYAPAPTVYPRWSYSHADADFSAATVTMTMDGAPVTVSSVRYDHAGFGERTLVWTPVLGAALTDGKEHRVTVTIGNIKQDGKTVSSTYTVILFDPGA